MIGIQREGSVKYLLFPWLLDDFYCSIDVTSAYPYHDRPTPEGRVRRGVGTVHASGQQCKNRGTRTQEKPSPAERCDHGLPTS